MEGMEWDPSSSESEEEDNEALYYDITSNTKLDEDHHHAEDSSLRLETSAEIFINKMKNDVYLTLYCITTSFNLPLWAGCVLLVVDSLQMLSFPLARGFLWNDDWVGWLRDISLGLSFAWYDESEPTVIYALTFFQAAYVLGLCVLYVYCLPVCRKMVGKNIAALLEDEVIEIERGDTELREWDIESSHAMKEKHRRRTSEQQGYSAFYGSRTPLQTSSVVVRVPGDVTEEKDEMNGEVDAQKEKKENDSSLKDLDSQNKTAPKATVTVTSEDISRRIKRVINRELSFAKRLTAWERVLFILFKYALLAYSTVLALPFITITIDNIFCKFVLDELNDCYNTFNVFVPIISIVIGLPAMVLSYNLTTTLFDNNPFSKDSLARIFAHSDKALWIIKASLVLIYVILSPKSWVLILLLICLVCGFFLVYSFTVYLAYHSDLINKVRVCGLSSFIWCTIISAFSQVANSTNPGENGLDSNTDSLSPGMMLYFVTPLIWYCTVQGIDSRLEWFAYTSVADLVHPIYIAKKIRLFLQNTGYMFTAEEYSIIADNQVMPKRSSTKRRLVVDYGEETDPIPGDPKIHDLIFVHEKEKVYKQIRGWLSSTLNYSTDLVSLYLVWGRYALWSEWNYNKAISLLQEVKNSTVYSSLNLSQKFQIFVLESSITELFNISECNKNVHVYVIHSRSISKCGQSHMVLYNLGKRVWSELLKPAPKAKRIYDLLKKLNKVLRQTTKAHKDLIRTNPKSPAVYQLFAIFLVEFMNERHKSMLALRKSEELCIQLKDATKTVQELKLYKKFLDMSFFNNECASVSISGSPNKLGQIITVNKRATEIFKCSSSDLCQRNISALMIEPYASLHNKFLRNYLETSEQQLMSKQFPVIFLDAEGNAFRAHVKLHEHLDSHLQLVYTACIWVIREFPPENDKSAIRESMELVVIDGQKIKYHSASAKKMIEPHLENSKTGDVSITTSVSINQGRRSSSQSRVAHWFPKYEEECQYMSIDSFSKLTSSSDKRHSEFIQHHSLEEELKTMEVIPTLRCRKLPMMLPKNSDFSGNTVESMKSIVVLQLYRIQKPKSKRGNGILSSQGASSGSPSFRIEVTSDTGELSSSKEIHAVKDMKFTFDDDDDLLQKKKDRRDQLVKDSVSAFAQSLRDESKDRKKLMTKKPTLQKRKSLAFSLDEDDYIAESKRGSRKRMHRLLQSKVIGENMKSREVKIARWMVWMLFAIWFSLAIANFAIDTAFLEDYKEGIDVVATAGEQRFYCASSAQYARSLELINKGVLPDYSTNSAQYGTSAATATAQQTANREAFKNAYISSLAQSLNFIAEEMEANLRSLSSKYDEATGAHATLIKEATIPEYEIATNSANQALVSLLQATQGVITNARTITTLPITEIDSSTQANVYYIINNCGGDNFVKQFNSSAFYFEDFYSDRLNDAQFVGFMFSVLSLVCLAVAYAAIIIPKAMKFSKYKSICMSIYLRLPKEFILSLQEYWKRAYKAMKNHRLTSITGYEQERDFVLGKLEIQKEVEKSAKLKSSQSKHKLTLGQESALSYSHLLRATEDTINKIDDSLKFSRNIEQFFPSHANVHLPPLSRTRTSNIGSGSEKSKTIFKLGLFFVLTALYFSCYQWLFIEPLATDLKVGLSYVNWNSLSRTQARQALTRSREYLLQLNSENKPTLQDAQNAVDDFYYAGYTVFDETGLSSNQYSTSIITDLELWNGCSVGTASATSRVTAQGGLPDIRIQTLDSYLYQPVCTGILLGSVGSGNVPGMVEAVPLWRIYNANTATGTAGIYNDTYRQLDQWEQVYLQANLKTFEIEYTSSIDSNVSSNEIAGTLLIASYVVLSLLSYFLAYRPFLDGLEDDINILQSFLLLVPISSLYSFENILLRASYSELHEDKTEDESKGDDEDKSMQQGKKESRWSTIAASVSKVGKGAGGVFKMAAHGTSKVATRLFQNDPFMAKDEKVLNQKLDKNSVVDKVLSMAVS
eukprot:Nk52_evm24s358 gene=Nk52_evmTU24s358